MYHKSPVAAHIFLIKGESILLLRRKNTGFEDGNYSVPAGHNEAGESIIESSIRELKEEVGIDVDPDNLEFISVMHRCSEEQRIDFFFCTKDWHGKIENMEKSKCDDLSWHPLHELPNNTIPYIRKAVENFKMGKSFDEFGWNKE